MAAVAVAVLGALGAQAPVGPFDKTAAHAQLALDTNRLERAIGLYERASFMAPERVDEISLDWGWAYVRKAHYSLLGRCFERGEAELRLAVETHPALGELVKAMWTYLRVETCSDMVGRVQMEGDGADWASVVDYMEETRQLVGDGPAVGYWLGVALHQAGRTEAARRQYLAVVGPADRTLTDLSALSQAARQVAEKNRPRPGMPIHPVWRKVDPGEFKVVEIRPFTVHHRNEEVAKRTVQALRYYRSQKILGGLIRPNDRLPRECHIYIHPSRKDMLRIPGMPKWADGGAIMLMVGGKTPKAAIHLFQNQPMEFENSVAHELAHVRVASNLNAHPGIPTWVQEGVATSVEMGLEREAALRILEFAREKGYFIPVKVMMVLPRAPDQAVYLYYAESLAMVESLVERFGRTAFWKLVRLSGTMPQERALASAFKITPVELENMVLEWIDDQRAAFDKKAMEEADRQAEGDAR